MRRNPRAHRRGVTVRIPRDQYQRLLARFLAEHSLATRTWPSQRQCRTVECAYDFSEDFRTNSGRFRKPTAHIPTAVSTNRVYRFDITTTIPCYPELECRLQRPDRWPNPRLSAIRSDGFAVDSSRPHRCVIGPSLKAGTEVPRDSRGRIIAINRSGLIAKPPL